MQYLSKGILYYLLLAAIPFSLACGRGQAASATFALNDINSSQISISISLWGFTAKPSTQGMRYRVCWSRADETSTDWICNINSQYASLSPFVITGPFSPGVRYKFLVYCHCYETGRIFNLAVWQPVAQDYDHVFTPPPPPLIAGNFRLRSESTGQCAYVDTNGNFMKNWPCWADPAMVFKRTDFSDGTSQLQHVNTGLCVWGFMPNSPDIRAGPCGVFGTRIEILPLGSGGRVRLYIRNTKFAFWSGPGGCLVASGSNGGTMGKLPCYNDLKFTFILDPA